VTSELFSSVYKEKSDHLFDDRIFSCPVPAFTYWSNFVPLSENPSLLVVFYDFLGVFYKKRIFYTTQSNVACKISFSFVAVAQILTVYAMKLN